MKLMAIDGNSLINRAYYGVRPLSTREGVPTNALYGFLNMYYKLLADIGPDGVCVCFDLRAKTFRHKMYDGYKAQRKPMPEELACQIPLVKEVLDLMGVPRLELEGYEADDLLGTLAKKCRISGDDCVIVTGDFDSLQFISEGARVALVKTKMGQTLTELFDGPAFSEKYCGLTADKIVDLKAIMGDKSDNIPGVMGIGEKGAMELLCKYGSLMGIYENLETADITPSMHKKLEDGREMAFLSYDLAKGITDVPFDKTPSELRLGKGDSGRLYDFLNKMELRSIIKRLGLTPSQEAEKPGDFEEHGFKRISSSEELKEVLASHEICCAFSEDMKEAAFECGGNTYISSQALLGDESWRDAVFALLESGRYICHDSKPLALYMYSQGRQPSQPLFDTAIAAYLMSPTSSDFSLEACALSSLAISISPSEGEGGQMSLSQDEVSNEAVLSKRAQATAALAAHFTPLLEQNGMKELMETIELPLIPILAEMQHIGMRLDCQRLLAFGDDLAGQIKSLEDKIYKQAGGEFNIGSTKQLGTVLFEQLGLKALKKTKTGYSTDADTLEKLKDQHDIIPLILEYRKLTKLKSTYVEGLLKVVAGDGRIHSSFNQMVTATGRLSSTDPNMQNIPIRREMGSEIRRCFVPAEGCVFVDADYSQIELRVLAHIASDERMLDAFNKGEDIHTVTASQVFGVPLDEVTSQMRSRAKAVNFGIVYGISAFSLSEDIGVYPKQAQQYIDAYLEKYHGVREYMTRIKTQAHEDGFVTTVFGRKRWIPELKSSNFNTRAFGDRVALNTPIQGAAADIIKLAMIRVWKALRQEGLNARLILQVHDELILECPKDEAGRAGEILGREMEAAASLSVRLRADVSRGDNWYEAKA
ncbi:MAG: DNA polymerase I [Clostridiaceae bacterium]|nr:DNA polymerase I [Clostridiaceae bacterium]